MAWIPPIFAHIGRVVRPLVLGNLGISAILENRKKLQREKARLEFEAMPVGDRESYIVFEKKE